MSYAVVVGAEGGCGGIIRVSICINLFIKLTLFRHKRELIVVLATPRREHILFVDVVADGLFVDELENINGSLRQELFDDLKNAWKIGRSEKLLRELSHACLPFMIQGIS